MKVEEVPPLPLHALSLMVEFQASGKALAKGFPVAPLFLSHTHKKSIYSHLLSPREERGHSGRVERGPNWQQGSRACPPPGGIAAPRAVEVGVRQRAQRNCSVCPEPRLPGPGAPSSHPAASAPHRRIAGSASQRVWAPSGSTFPGHPAAIICPLIRPQPIFRST